MLINLFSMFDRRTYTLNPLISSFVVIFLILRLKSLWVSINSIQFSKRIVLNKGVKELSQDMKKLASMSKFSSAKNVGVTKIFIIIFLSVFLLNYISLFPIVFSVTSHISVRVTFRFIIWLRVLILFLEERKVRFLSHITPLGTPNALISFIVCIERVRFLIRPITLAVRLTANLVAGHLLLFLLSKICIFLEKIFFFSTPFLIMLGTLETIVAIIQSYVITLLLVLYFKEMF